MRKVEGSSPETKGRNLLGGACERQFRWGTVTDRRKTSASNNHLLGVMILEATVMLRRRNVDLWLQATQGIRST